MRNKKHLFITLLIFGLLGCRYVGQKSAATSEAEAWARAMGMSDVKIDCAGQDSDGDGYVSCTVNTGGKIQQIECGGAWTCTSGCRVPKAILGS